MFVFCDEFYNVSCIVSYRADCKNDVSRISMSAKPMSARASRIYFCTLAICVTIHYCNTSCCLVFSVQGQCLNVFRILHIKIICTIKVGAKIYIGKVPHRQMYTRKALAPNDIRNRCKTWYPKKKQKKQKKKEQQGVLECSQLVNGMFALQPRYNCAWQRHCVLVSSRVSAFFLGV